jgi:hypothetical protein
MRAGGDERHQSILTRATSIQRQEDGISSMTEDPPKDTTS